MIPSSLGPTQENDSFYQVLLMQLFLKMCFPLSTQILVTLGATKWFFISFFRFFHLHSNTFTYILCNCMASIAKIESFLQCSHLYGLSILQFPNIAFNCMTFILNDKMSFTMWATNSKSMLFPFIDHFLLPFIVSISCCSLRFSLCNKYFNYLFNNFEQHSVVCQF